MDTDKLCVKYVYSDFEWNHIKHHQNLFKKYKHFQAKRSLLYMNLKTGNQVPNLIKTIEQL